MRTKITIVVALIALFAAACGEKKTTTEAPSISTAKASMGTIEKTVMFSGSIDAADAVDVFPKATGKISGKILKEGDAVKKGDTIMLIDRDEIGLKFKPLPVDSPIDGFIGAINVDVGANVDTDTNVAKVVRPGKMRVKLDIPERYLNTIIPGTEVKLTVDTLDNKTFDGNIATLGAALDERTRTARVEVDVPNPDNILRHGMFGRMNLVTERKDNVLSVPNETISWEGDKQFVYKVNGDKVERRQVKVGLRNETHVEIAEGVSEGDTLAASNLIDLKDGETVKIKL